MDFSFNDIWAKFGNFGNNNVNKTNNEVTLKIDENKLKESQNVYKYAIPRDIQDEEVILRDSANENILSRYAVPFEPQQDYGIVIGPSQEPTSEPIIMTDYGIVVPEPEPTPEPIIMTYYGIVVPEPEPTPEPTVMTAYGLVTPPSEPTVEPTVAPTTTPTVAPTTTPSVAPTVAPSTTPTVAPTVTPTVAPTVEPTTTTGVRYNPFSFNLWSILGNSVFGSFFSGLNSRVNNIIKYFFKL